MNRTLYNSHKECTSFLCINIELKNKVECRMICIVECYLCKLKTPILQVIIGGIYMYLLYIE